VSSYGVVFYGSIKVVLTDLFVYNSIWISTNRLSCWDISYI